MSWEHEMKSYLHEIDRYLGKIDKPVKKSILKEIEDHLLAKVEDTKSELQTKRLSPHQFRQLLIAFGDPKEIAREYRRTVSAKDNQKHPGSVKPWMPFIICLVVIVLLLAIIWSPDSGDDDQDEEIDLSMPEGPWFQSVEWGPQHEWAIAVSESDGLFTYDGDILRNLTGYPEGKYTGITWHPTELMFVITGSSGTIMISNTTGEYDVSIPITDGFQEIDFNPSGEYALAVGNDGHMATINETNVSYRYLPDNITDTSFYDLDWDSNSGSALLVGYTSNNFLSGSIIEFVPGENETLNGTFFEISLPTDMSTCFGIKWIEEWNQFILLCNGGQIYSIDENRTVTRIDNTHTGLAPLFDAVYLPNEEKVLIVGGNAGYDSSQRTYRLDWSSRYVLTYDGENLQLIDSDLGPHIQVCEWNPIHEHAVMLGAFGSSWIYQNGTVFDIEIGI